jgi:hypothetical protein
VARPSSKHDAMRASMRSGLTTSRAHLVSRPVAFLNDGKATLLIGQKEKYGSSTRT